jgi:hypothetical protein
MAADGSKETASRAIVIDSGSSNIRLDYLMSGMLHGLFLRHAAAVIRHCVWRNNSGKCPRIQQRTTLLGRLPMLSLHAKDLSK